MDRKRQEGQVGPGVQPERETGGFFNVFYLKGPAKVQEGKLSCLQAVRCFLRRAGGC